jgi:hypothetical protein
MIVVDVMLKDVVTVNSNILSLTNNYLYLTRNSAVAEKGDWINDARLIYCRGVLVSLLLQV